jgi:uncharacterized protein YlxW (UPF0749 family)
VLRRSRPALGFAIVGFVSNPDNWRSIGGGIFALIKGFQLVLEGKGKTKEESSLEFLGVKASVGSIVSLVMVKAFMWGWAAKLALPSYKDAEVEIHALRQELTQTETALASLKEQNAGKLAEVENLENRLAAARSALEQSQMTIAAAVDERKEKQKELKAQIEEQQTQ